MAVNACRRRHDHQSSGTKSSGVSLTAIATPNSTPAVRRLANSSRSAAASATTITDACPKAMLLRPGAETTNTTATTPTRPQGSPLSDVVDVPVRPSPDAREKASTAKAPADSTDQATPTTGVGSQPVHTTRYRAGGGKVKTSPFPRT